MNERRRSAASLSSLTAVLPRAPGRVAADRVAAILATRRLALSDVSRESRRRFPVDPRFHIPHNFYFQLYSTGLSPTLHQVSAISELTNYHLSDWLSVFGFRLDAISHLQATLSRERTALLDSSVYNTGAVVSWLTAREEQPSLTGVVPLSRIFAAGPILRLSSLVPAAPSRFLYAKIGRQDCLAFPELLPGSIVRADPASVERLLALTNGEITRHLFLVEHSNGFCCSRLRVGANRRITLASTKLPLAHMELQLGAEARVLGALDLELRPLTHPVEPAACPILANLWKPSPLVPRSTQGKGGTLLQHARLRAGLSFRQASDKSRQIASAFRDGRYFVSSASLSDYEASDGPPRHIHKIFSLCILYGLSFADLTKAFGLLWDVKEREPIPEKCLDPRGGDEAPQSQVGKEQSFDEKHVVPPPLDRLEEVPFFLRDSLPAFSGLDDVSLRDVFWIEGSRPLHPALEHAFLVIINHRKKKPRLFRRKHAWEQPAYLVMKRDGSHLLGSFSLEKGMLVLHTYSRPFAQQDRFTNRVDAEIVGQVVTVLRSLLPSWPPPLRQPSG
jgi:hypothetical protein